MAYHGLDVYLNDHLAGGTAGVNLAEMAAQGIVPTSTARSSARSPARSARTTTRSSG